MPEITFTFLLLLIGAILLGILLGRKDYEIRKLKKEKEDTERNFRSSVNLAARIIGEANILDVSPKRLPKEFDDIDRKE